MLTDAGFSREDPADEHGEFAVRGGIVDIFPAGEARPVRLEFIGDTIETLRTYDPSTQRSIAAIDQIAIVPLRDVLNDDRRATVFDYFARAKSSRTGVCGAAGAATTRPTLAVDSPPRLSVTVSVAMGVPGAR